MKVRKHVFDKQLRLIQKNSPSNSRDPPYHKYIDSSNIHPCTGSIHNRLLLFFLIPIRTFKYNRSILTCSVSIYMGKFVLVV